MNYAVVVPTVVVAVILIGILIWVFGADDREKKKHAKHTEQRAQLRERFEKAELVAQERGILDSDTEQATKFKTVIADCRAIERDGRRSLDTLRNKVETLESIAGKD